MRTSGTPVDRSEWHVDRIVHVVGLRRSVAAGAARHAHSIAASLLATYSQPSHLFSFYISCVASPHSTVIHALPGLLSSAVFWWDLFLRSMSGCLLVLALHHQDALYQSLHVSYQRSPVPVLNARFILTMVYAIYMAVVYRSMETWFKSSLLRTLDFHVHLK